MATETWVASDPSSAGTINFAGGHLTTTTLLAASSDLTGTGTINTNGLVSDVDLVFDATHGTTQTFSMNADPGQCITVNLTANGTGAMGAGFKGVGTTTISDGVTVGSTMGTVGYRDGSDGTFNVDGAGSTWTNSGDVTVGHAGTGELNITNGGAVSNNRSVIGGYDPAASGTVNVDGAGSTWTNTSDIKVGWRGDAILRITNGAVVTNTDASLGDEPSGTGTAIVDGPGSTWTNTEDLRVGYSDGTGVLTITNGGTVSNYYGILGYYAGSSGTVTVDGVGSSWTSTGRLLVGRNAGSGVLNIIDGGTVNSARGNIGGSQANSSGLVTVDGVGSRWLNSGDLLVGDDGEGDLAISNGGLVRVTGAMSMGGSSQNTVNMATGGMLALLGNAAGSVQAFLDLVDGHDTILYWDSSAGDWDSITQATFGVDYSLDYFTSGDLAGYTMLTVDPAWHVVTGDFDSDGDTDLRDIEILCDNLGGNPGTYDMDGDGDVDADDMIALVQTYLEFDSDGDGTPDGTGTFLGDFNADGIVDGTDLSILSGGFGGSGGFAGGDSNGDGTINGTDLSILSSTFGNVATAAVPEPVTLGLLAIGGMAMLRRRRR